jgi:type 1 fimbriae regulatory protein FimB/type 1 fimbriae regulatory protein FimE
MRKTNLAEVLPGREHGTVSDRVIRFPAKRTGPRRPKNRDVRTREYLTRSEVERLLEAAKGNRHSHRDATMILVASRHGLRVSELINLRWEQVDFSRAELHVTYRAKRGRPAVHEIPGRELRWLRRLQREQEPRSPFVFISERGTPFTSRGVYQTVVRLGEAAGIPFPIHPHMLRHACGCMLANDGHPTATIQKQLGHSSILSTQRYTELAPQSLKGLFRD